MSTSATKWFAIGFMRQTSIPGDLALYRPAMLVWHGQGSSGPECSLQMSHGLPCPSWVTLSFNDGRIWVWRHLGECFHDASVGEHYGYGPGSGVGWLQDASQDTPATCRREPDRHWHFANFQEFPLANFYLPGIECWTESPHLLHTTTHVDNSFERHNMLWIFHWRLCSFMVSFVTFVFCWQVLTGNWKPNRKPVCSMPILALTIMLKTKHAQDISIKIIFQIWSLLLHTIKIPSPTFNHYQ